MSRRIARTSTVTPITFRRDRGPGAAADHPATRTSTQDRATTGTCTNQQDAADYAGTVTVAVTGPGTDIAPDAGANDTIAPHNGGD